MATITVIDIQPLVRFPAASVVTPVFNTLEPQLIVAKFFDPPIVASTSGTFVDVADSSDVLITPIGFGILNNPTQSFRLSRILDPATVSTSVGTFSTSPDNSDVLITTLGFENVFERLVLLESDVTVIGVKLDFLASDITVKSEVLSFLESDTKAVVESVQFIESDAAQFGSRGQTLLESDVTALDPNLTFLASDVILNIVEALSFQNGDTAPILSGGTSTFLSSDTFLAELASISSLPSDTLLAQESRGFISGDVGQTATETVGFLSGSVLAVGSVVTFLESDVSVFGGSRSLLAADSTPVNLNRSFLSADTAISKSSLSIRTLLGDAVAVTLEQTFLESDAYVFDNATQRYFVESTVYVKSEGTTFVGNRSYSIEALNDPLFNEYVTGVIT